MNERARVPSFAAALALACGASACVSPVGQWNDAEHPSSWSRPAAGASAASEGGGDYPLYARDGGVVDAPGPGSVTAESQPTHEVEPGRAGGRMYILELYQDAIDERDALQLEVASLTGEVERLGAQLADLRERLARAQSENRELVAQRDRLLAENDELTGRLVTAQIRRLEAEELLLETKLERLEAPAGAASPSAGPGEEGAAGPADSEGAGPSAGEDEPGSRPEPTPPKGAGTP